MSQKKDSGFQETEEKPVKYQFTEYTSGHKPLPSSPKLSHVGSLFLLTPMLPKDRVDLLLHEGPWHLRALQWALVSAGTIGLFASLLDDGVPTAGEAELVEGV